MPEKTYTIEEIRAIVTPIAQKYGVERVYLLKKITKTVYSNTCSIV